MEISVVYITLEYIHKKMYVINKDIVILFYFVKSVNIIVQIRERSTYVSKRKYISVS